MADKPFPYPDRGVLPQSRARLNGQRINLSLQPSAMYRALAIVLLAVACGAVAAEIVSIVVQNNHLKHVITDQATLFFAALLKISRGTLEVDVVDSCPTQQGVFVVDNTTDPPVQIVQNDDVPATVDQFELGDLTWTIPNGTLTITGNYTKVTGGDEFPCCDPFANPVGTKCDCVWPTADFGGLFEKCGDRSFFTLDYDYCEADLTNAQQLGVDNLEKSFDPNRPQSSTNKLNITHSQVRVDGNLTTGGTQQLPISVTELLPAFQHQTGYFLLSDVIGCPLGSMCDYPDPFAYQFAVFQIVEPMVLSTPNIADTQVDLGFCFSEELFPIDPNPYVKQLNPLTDDPDDYYMNNLAQDLLQCGIEFNELYQSAGDLTAQMLFGDMAWVSSPFFPIRKGATYRVEFGCTAINMYLTNDDDDLYAFQDLDYTPAPGVFPLEGPIGKFQWCSHMYDNLADDDACTLPPQSVRDEYLAYLSVLSGFQSVGIFGGSEIDSIVKQLISQDGDDNQALRGVSCCDMRYDSSCISKSPNINTNLFPHSAGLFNTELPTRNWTASAFQLYTICAGVDSSAESSPSGGLQGQMFFSVQRVNPMVWLTGSEGMSYDLEGHAYWSVNDTILDQHPGFLGQCGVFSAATPFMFNEDQQVVNPSISMENVPGFEDLPYPNQVAGDLPSFNHLCNTKNTMMSNCHVRVRSFLPGEPEVVSTTSKKRDSSVYEPATGHVYWKGNMKDMPKAKAWDDPVFGNDKAAREARRRVDELLKKVEKQHNEEKRAEIRRRHALNVESVVARSRRPATIV